MLHLAENLNESPISWEQNLLPLCQIRSPSEEREGKWLLRCNGTQIICYESTVVMVSECVSGLSMFANLCVCEEGLSSVKLWTASTGLCCPLKVQKQSVCVHIVGMTVCRSVLDVESGTKSITRLSAPLTPSRAFRQLSVHRFVS